MVASMSATALVLVELLHQAERLLELLGHVGIELDAGLDPPEQVRGDADIAEARPVIAFAANPLVDPEYLLDHHDRALGRALRLGEIGCEAAVAAQRFDRDRRHEILLF
jgi:hypothetical protein